MEITDSKIIGLKKKVAAALDEFESAMACFEAWKPAAYDWVLHKRMGHSYATNTFNAVRNALRREMLLALTRLWDTDQRSVGMSQIAAILGDQQIMDTLAAACEAQWGRRAR